MRRFLIFVFWVSIAAFVHESSYAFKLAAVQAPGVGKIRPRTKKKSSKTPPTKVEARRDALHKMMLNGEYQHDGSSELVHIGDITSVPALLQVLKDNPSTRMPDGRLFGVCTAAHAYEALVKITGNKESKTYEEWKAWWEQYQKEHPVK